MRSIINLILFLCTAAAMLDCFRKNGRWNWTHGLKALRFFTILSNLLCGLAALLAVLTLRRGTLPCFAWLIKYVATASVTVTLLTVLVFLGPTMGYSTLFRGRDIYLHLIGPLLAVFSFCFLERDYPLSLAASLWGVVPVVLYGIVYLYKVVLGPENGRWEDFYGFNKNGRWAVSFTAMMAGGLIVCLLLRALTRIGAV